MGMALTMALDYAHTDSKLWGKLAGFAVAITFGVTIAYSRLFLGVHSLDQVLYGLLLGSWCAFTMQFCVRINLEEDVRLMITCKVTDFKKRFLICCAAFAFIMAY